MHNFIQGGTLDQSGGGSLSASSKSMDPRITMNLNSLLLEQTSSARFDSFKSVALEPKSATELHFKDEFVTVSPQQSGILSDKVIEESEQAEKLAAYKQ